jgi:RimJ/RimL family protein N-acetyltransferase
MKKDIKLINERILLRPYCTSDAATVYEAARESVHEVGMWLPWCHAGYSMKESKNWIKLCAKSWEEGTAYEFAIFDSRTGQYLGGCGLNHIDPAYKTANLGYWVRTSQTKHGVATTAAVLLVRFGLAELKLNRIEIVAAVGNSQSQRVAEKAGAKREGILRNRILLEGRAHDAVVFSFIPQDSILNIDR